CTKKSILKGIKKGVAKGNIPKACRQINRFRQKYPACPLPPIPGLPDAAACAGAGVPLVPVPPLGRGRGGGMVGGGPAGGSVGGLVFGFNSANSSNCFSYTVVPDPANPPGFTVVGGTGTMTIPLLSMATVPFTVDVAPGVPVGTCAFFDVIIKDKGNGLDVPDDFKRVKVTVLDKLEVILDQTDFRVIDGVPSKARWRVRNLDTVPVAVPYAFSVVDDPGSVMENNAGVPFPVPDAFSLPRSAAGGGSLALDAAGGPNDEGIIEWDMVPGEYCDPAMIGCCVVEIPPGNAVSGQCFVNVNSAARCCPTAEVFLIKGVSTGGFIDVNIGAQNVLVPLPPAATEQDVVDLVAQAVNQKSKTDDGFDFTAVPMFEELAIEHRAGLPVDLLSGDPGLFIVALPPTGEELNVGPDTIVQRKADLTAVTPVSIINTVPMSEPDVSSIQTFNGSGGPPLLLAGQSYTSTADFVVTQQNLPPPLPLGFFTVDPSPLGSGDQAFNVMVPLAFGPGPDVEMDVFIHVRPNGFDGVGQTQVQIDPLTIQAIPTGPNSFQIIYQAQVLNNVEGIQHEHIIAAGATNVPNLCLFPLGDLNHDGQISGFDVPLMVNAILAGASAADVPCADFNGDGVIDGGDLPGFIAALTS
ncbi:MAG: dockerin type I domain-containing protein, partial [Phycisphaerae bacterium]